MSTTHSDTATRTRTTDLHAILWILQVLLAAMFLLFGGQKLIGAQPMVDLFNTIGIGQWLRYLTGGLEIAGAVALLIPRLAALGALLLAGVMVGAVITDVLLGASPLMAVVYLVISAVVAWGRRDRLSIPLGR